MFACECYWYVYVCLYYSLAMLCCCCLLEACFWLKDVMIFSVDRRSRCHGILQKKKTCLIKHLDSFFLATCVCVYVRSRFVFCVCFCSLFFLLWFGILLQELFFYFIDYYFSKCSPHLLYMYNKWAIILNKKAFNIFSKINKLVFLSLKSRQM